MVKYSVYLKEKCRNLAQTLTFFKGDMGNYRTPGSEKRLMFLEQIDFWSWEMDSLIYSFETFKERQTLWNDNHADKLSKFPIKSDIRRSSQYAKNNIEAPMDDLNALVKQWNELLEWIEHTLFVKNHEDKAEKFGWATKDLEQYYKEIKNEKM